MNRPAVGFITRRPEEPDVTSTSPVLWEPGVKPRLPDPLEGKAGVLGWAPRPFGVRATVQEGTRQAHTAGHVAREARL